MRNGTTPHYQQRLRDGVEPKPAKHEPFDFSALIAVMITIAVMVCL